MNRYTIPCTEEQLRKALELGAPLDIYAVEYDNSDRKDNEFNIINDIVFDYGVTICHNEYGGKGTWDSNPWVFVYDFKLIK